MSDQLEKGILSLGAPPGPIIDEENNAEPKDDEDINKELGDKGALSDAATFGEAAATFGEAAAPEEVAATFGEAAAPEEAVALIQPEVEALAEPPPIGTDAPTLQEIVMNHAETLSQEDQKDPGEPVIIDFGSEDLSEDIAIPYIGKQDTSMNELQKEVSRHTKELELLRQIVKFLLKNKKTKKKPRNKRKKSHTSKKKKSVKKPRKTVKKGKQSVSKRMR